MNREVAITNRHPRLRFRRAEVARVIHVLDTGFVKSPLERGLSAIGSATADAAKRRGVSAVPAGELSLVFLTDPALAKIHGDFMADPTATDVITFAGEPTALGSEALAKEAGLAGEICVSADTAARYVGASLVDARGRPQGTPLQEKFSAELTLYVVHGWLHLAGYDDLQPAKKRRMRAAEARAMKLLRAAKAVPEFRLA
ncbi:rRNA maturation RNase YbeY [Opitutus sp. GAS368]|jgi:probable rRNA maturation factor|uniref:rRNA maturation RNase YbeY n=1 Tax=Opitutus sp. GAS368 TaxID=1882749 RepID=UPI00087B1183|nr:rRNA maturation RNase YbeY [Opitutus sp. GAS368]SDR67732.1 probable rRNA maturation factor [Opitutus sp. GAS368]